MDGSRLFAVTTNAAGGQYRAARHDPVAVEAAFEDELQRGGRVARVGRLHQQVGDGTGGGSARDALAVAADP
ncbi:hypothetical protein [Streptomyces azureus]|uniref:Uncharacterized protein n=1 Tax=Streptomyces azureus TaxID=146537 RepID=A0A0K8PCK5_STRAJ|nr:hypothetical protein [Streptomyces azureus]GAP45605.1 uncharacterized protein SAZU_0336 [Streptomyces azureus]